jgi:predicted transcriptional regulator of viral defense system
MTGRTTDAVLSALQSANAPLTVRELQELGASRATLTRMVEAELIERLAHGVYGLPQSGSPHIGWAGLSLRVPSAVFCLTSAASFHEITQDMETRTVLAVPHALGQVQGGKGKSYPVRVKMVRWRNPEAFEFGVDKHLIDGVSVQITSPARTVVDMFRFSGLNVGCRKVRIQDEAFLDCIARALDPARQVADPDDILLLADRFNVRDRISPFVKSMNHAINTGYMA